MSPSFPLLFAHLLLFALVSARRPRVPWANDAVFVTDTALTDEFSGSQLNLTRWDPHGLRNPDTNCPKWNGPPSRASPDYSTFFPTTTDPDTGLSTESTYSLSRGRLLLSMGERDLSYFTKREYFCNSTTFKCNYDESIDCFSTNFFGSPNFKPGTREYLGVVHDKCKKEPYCIPHPEYVTGSPRVYKKYVGTHIVSRKTFKYGFVEVRVKMAKSPAVAGAWMHNDEMVNGYCRYRSTRPSDNSNFPRLRECPSVIRSRRWQEIDMLESMNSLLHKRLYIPNIHAFAGYKGEFTSAVARDEGDGQMGGGPIMVPANVFNEKRPDFSDVAEGNRTANDWHYNRGSVADLDADWAAKSRVVGMYWSPREIRFYIDGVEVRRLKNTIIHQPMFMDLSYALNVPWAKQAPTSREIRRKLKFMYIRKWDVFTPGGEDPPSSLPLDEKMEQTFRDVYGSEMEGVFGRFPQMDDLTIEQSIPERPDIVITPEPAPETELLGDGSGTSRMAMDVDADATDYLSSEIDALTARVISEHGDKSLRRAGGNGNARFSMGRRRMTGAEKRIALGNPERVSVVKRRGGKAVVVDDPETTVFEFSNPNKDMAGWSTPGGRGEGSSLA